MSTDENREEGTESSNSQESNTRPSKASIERDDELTTKEPAKERKVVVVKPSEVEYKENSQIEYSSVEEQNKEEEGEIERSRCCCQSQRSRNIIYRNDKDSRQKSSDQDRREV